MTSSPETPSPVDAAPAAALVTAGELVDVSAVSVSGAFVVLCWIELYRQLDSWIWGSSYVASHSWMYIALAIALSLVVGVGVKWFSAPTIMSGSLIDSFKGVGARPRWQLIPITMVNALASLLSGASVGPEAPIGTISMQVADGYNRLRHRAGPRAAANVLAAAAAAFNGLLENPIFTSVLASDVAGDRRSLARNMPANLIAGAIGYLVFLAVGTKGFAGYLGLPQPEHLHWSYLVYDVAFALIGIVLAVVTGVLMRASGAIFGRLSQRVLLRALIGGLIAGCIGVFIPVASFSGEAQIFTLIGDPSRYSEVELVGLALLKLSLLAVAFKTGFLGGPTFPSIFAATAVGIAINAAFPGLPLVVILAGIIAGQIMMLFTAPFMVILFVAFFLSANTNVLVLVIIAVAVAMIVAPYLQAAMARRQTPKAPAAGSATS